MGSSGSRGGLFREALRVAAEHRIPMFLENVAATREPLRHSGGAAPASVVLGELADAGYDAFACSLTVAAIGGPHLRERWFVLAFPRGEEPPETDARPGTIPWREVPGWSLLGSYWPLTLGPNEAPSDVPRRVRRGENYQRTIELVGGAVCPAQGYAAALGLLGAWGCSLSGDEHSNPLLRDAELAAENIRASFRQRVRAFEGNRVLVLVKREAGVWVEPGAQQCDLFASERTRRRPWEEREVLPRNVAMLGGQLFAVHQLDYLCDKPDRPLWSTPMARSWKQPGAPGSATEARQYRRTFLEAQVQVMARGGLKVKPTEDELHPRRPKLNPQWVEQLMGLAPGAVSTCKAAPKAARKRSARGSKTIEPAAE
jgi:hypothetical protein